MSNPFLSNVWGGMQPAQSSPFAAGEQLAGVGAPSPTPVVSGLPPAPPPPMLTPPGPAPMSSANEDPSKLMSVAPPPVSQGPKAAPVGVEPPKPAPPPAPPGIGQATSMGGEQFPLQRMAGGTIKAHEVERRGPSLLAAQQNRNEVSEATIDRVEQRGADAANHEYSMALDQERQARLRQDAAAQAEAERADEMAQRQADFDQTTRQMAKHGTLDRDRFWASRSTGQKIAGVVEMMLAGFRGAPSLVQKRIDDDVKAQEFAYYATRDTNQAKQTAFAMAMQKYQNADAARAAARAAAMDVVGAQLQQVGAKWKGTETANRADMAYAALQDERMMQIAQGIQFVPTMRTGGGFIDPRTGIQYTNAEAQKISNDIAARNAKREELVTGIGGQLTIAGANNAAELEKAKLTQHAKAQDRTVMLPNGEVITTRNDKEMETVQNLATAVHSAQQLVSEAKAIRSETGWWANPKAMERLQAIQGELTTAFKDSKGLGALSGSDIGLAMQGTGDVTSRTNPAVNEHLDSFAMHTNKALQNRVRTIPGAPANAQGKLSAEAQGSFTPHGSK